MRTDPESYRKRQDEITKLRHQIWGVIIQSPLEVGTVTSVLNEAASDLYACAKSMPANSFKGYIVAYPYKEVISPEDRDNA